VGLTDNCIEVHVAADSWAVSRTMDACVGADDLMGNVKRRVRVDRTLGIIRRIRVVACRIVGRRLLAILGTSYSLIVGGLQATIVDR